MQMNLISTLFLVVLFFTLNFIFIFISWIRSLQGMPNKRLKPEFPRVLQRMPPSGRYPKNAPPVP